MVTLIKLPKFSSYKLDAATETILEPNMAKKLIDNFL